VLWSADGNKLLDCSPKGRLCWRRSPANWKGPGRVYVAGISSASLTGSQFIRNVSQGGSGGSDNQAGNAIGGAIGNAGALTVTGSTFSDNQAVGGDKDSGSISGRAKVDSHASRSG